jgi:peroxidase
MYNTNTYGSSKSLILEYNLKKLVSLTLNY